MVHETLTADAGDIVDFDAVVSRLVRMVEEGLGAPERPVKIEVSGSIGALGGDVSMPLAVVVTELLQNSIDHGSGSDHPVIVRLGGDSKELSICVQDHGPGVPDGFSLDRDAGLGVDDCSYLCRVGSWWSDHVCSSRQQQWSTRCRRIGGNDG